MTVDHDTEHDICHSCYHDRHTEQCLEDYHKLGIDPETDEDIEVLTIMPVQDSRRCCFCGRHSRDGLVEVAPATEVPRHNKDPEWMRAAGIKPEELYVPEDEDGNPIPPDPREIASDQ